MHKNPWRLAPRTLIRSNSLYGIPLADHIETSEKEGGNNDGNSVNVDNDDDTMLGLQDQDRDGSISDNKCNDSSDDDDDDGYSSDKDDGIADTRRDGDDDDDDDGRANAAIAPTMTVAKTPLKANVSSNDDRGTAVAMVTHTNGADDTPLPESMEVEDDDNYDIQKQSLKTARWWQTNPK